MPILLGYAPVGMAFGILARTLGFSIAQATICSATALAGAGQFIALSTLSSGTGAAAALIATGVVNLRYVLFASTMAPHVKTTRTSALAWLGFSLTDETFAVNIADVKAGRSTTASKAGVGLVAWIGWVTGTLIGAAFAGAIGDPTRFGVEFAMPAMFSALFVALAEDRRHVGIGALAALLAVCVPLLGNAGIVIDNSWTVIAASVGAATVGAVVFRER